MGPTVLIVDDHAGFRSWARALLLAEGYDVVGEAEDGPSAVAAWRNLRAQVVLLDIRLPGIDGFAVAKSLQTETDPPAVVLISTRAASDFGTRVARSGARGFISKRELSAAALEKVLGSVR
jgi:DNA-binding NarL/FixJ family response regulator